MEILGNILMVIGIIGIVITAIWLLILLQFQTSILWGLACLFIPFVALIWLVIYWSEADAKYPFCYSVLSTVVLFVGAYMAGDSLTGIA